MADSLTKAAIGRSGRSALRTLAKAYRRFVIEHAGLYALTQGAFDPGSADHREETARALEIIAAVTRSYGVPDSLSIHAIRMVRAGLHGFADIEARGGFQLADSMDESYVALVDSLDASLHNFWQAKRPPWA